MRKPEIKRGSLLAVTENTVKSHVNAILAKMKAGCLG
jgi:DNA-binding NarL/FixJ family response regulator